MTKAERLNLAHKVAWSMYGLPYIWAGDDPIAGLDCSGFVIEILKSVGILPIEGDWSAQSMWDMWKGNKEVTGPYLGCLVFWQRNDGTVRHIEFCLNDTLSIGASGGDEHVQTRSDAIGRNAYIKVRPILGRGVVKGFIDPFLE